MLTCGTARQIKSVPVSALTGSGASSRFCAPLRLLLLTSLSLCSLQGPCHAQGSGATTGASATKSHITALPAPRRGMH